MHVKRLRAPLRIAFRRSEAPVEESAPITPAPAVPEVEFVAYGEDCLLSGHARLDADRLTDMLNQYDEYLLVDVLAEPFAEGRPVEVREILIKRDDLYLVHATGPRGSEARRHRTRAHPLAFQLGPYHVRGYFHALPGADPISAFRRRKPMVPLTDAWIEYAANGLRTRRRVSAVVINREQVDWVVPALDEQIELPDLPMTTKNGPLLKDFTGSLFGESSGQG